MLDPSRNVDHEELDVLDLEVRYKASNERISLNVVNLDRAIREGLSFTVALRNPEIVRSGKVVMTLIIVGANMTLGGTSGVFSKNPHAAIVQKVITIQGGNPATVTIDLLHDETHFRDILWHEGGGPYETTLSVAPVVEGNTVLEDVRRGLGVDLASVFDIDSHTTHIDYHFVGV